MTKLVWIVCGFCAAGIGLVAWGGQRQRPVEELARRLESAWADHHTIV